MSDVRSIITIVQWMWLRSAVSFAPVSRNTPDRIGKRSGQWIQRLALDRTVKGESPWRVSASSGSAY